LLSHKSLGGGPETNGKLKKLGYEIVKEGNNSDAISGKSSESQSRKQPENRTECVKHELNRILYGPPGTGKTYGTVRHALAIIDGLKVGDAGDDRERFRALRFEPDNDKGQIAMVTFHQSFAYEDFVEGIRPCLREEDEDLSYELHEGIFKRIARAAAKLESSNKAFVLIIDEINCGNIAKIFGELITLIEDSRRIGKEDETKVTLPYSQKMFGVPGNLYIIGTMNTADRSIQLLDTALRRRFTFFEMMPNHDHELVSDNVDGINCRELMKAMNKGIAELLDREHQIGHTNFFDIDSMQKLADRFQHKIFPLLQEYFFEDWQKIYSVLNKNAFVIKSSRNNDEDTDIYERLPHDDRRWHDPQEYKKIYAGER